MQVIQTYVTRCNGDDLVIAPLGDIQYTGREEHIAGRRLDSHVGRCLGLDAYFVGTGDYIDFASPSNRRKLKAADLYDTATIVFQDAARHLTDELYTRHLSKTRGRWLGLVEGHHYSSVGPGLTTDEYLAEQLHCPFLGTSALIRISVADQKGRHGLIRLWVHHGEGTGDPLARLAKIAANFRADYYIMGHTTQRGVKPVSYIYDTMANGWYPSLADRTYWLVATGGWLKAYAEDSQVEGKYEGDYAEKAMYTPSSHGSPLLTITCQWTKNRVWVPEFRAEA